MLRHTAVLVVCVQEDELRALLDKKPHPVCYDGFEPSGRMHIAQGVMKAINVRACVVYCVTLCSTVCFAACCVTLCSTLCSLSVSQCAVLCVVLCIVGHVLNMTGLYPIGVEVFLR